EGVAFEGRIQVRELPQCERHRLDDQVVERDLRGVVSELGVDLLAEGDRRVHIDLGRDVEMRDDLLALGHSLSGRLPNPAHLASNAGRTRRGRGSWWRGAGG